ncbi:pyranose dehydrogenase [Mycena alexandri]|uniref:Pyranose dehydrogenase n=1 Tax=Mycena alexandri TaxID=1745969 RepID=A0AAD6T0G9_9AGAR|nr:pyranose dehydrogenase [Mycena alexandri]
MLLPTFFALSVLSRVGLCKLYEDVSELPGLHYDFVIAGGGTAGNVVANRLSENPHVSVLVLEAGPSNIGVLESEVPFLSTQMFLDPTYSWNYTTTPIPGFNGRSVSYNRAFILGGCSAHNGMAYTRGAAADFDRYAELSGDARWSWNQLFPYFLKTEKWSPPADQHDTRGQFNPHVHGTNGPISVSLNGFALPFFEGKIIQTTKELPDDFPFNLDPNSGNELGVSWVQSTIGGGERSTSATGYFAPKFIQRQNLHVLLHAQVSKLVNATRKKGKPTFGGVEFRYGESFFVAHAAKEIVLSGGVIGSPQILMNSGIGAHSTLSALGIPTILDLPSVGQNASDQPLLILQWALNATSTPTDIVTFDSLRQNATRFAEGLAQWNASHTGPFVDSGDMTHLGWARLPRGSPAFGVHADPAAGPDAPHLEFSFVPGGQTPGNSLSIFVAVVSPVSRGSVVINSSDPFAPPLINPGYFSNEWDLLAMRDGISLAERFVSAPAWRGFLGAMMPNLANLSSADLETTIRNTAAPNLHMVGTAGMSGRGARYGVVDPDLQVKGAVGLSVIDASVVPIVPAGHTQAATYAFAERGSDLLKQRWGL